MSLRDLDPVDFSRMQQATILACYSGDASNLPGRWVVSLPEALLRRGANSVLASMWALDENVARAISLRFLKEASRTSRAQALQEIQKKSIRSNSRPILVGRTSNSWGPREAPTPHSEVAMAVNRRLLRVIISSKQSDFVVERQDIARIMEPMPLLVASAAESWAPSETPVERRSVEEAASCAIYVGLFGCVYSAPTILEYEAAAANENRARLIYVRDCPSRDPKLSKFLERSLHPQTGNTVVSYKEWAQVSTRFEHHLWEAVARMIENLLKLAKPPTAMGRDRVMARQWQNEVQALEQLGLPSVPVEAEEFVAALRSAAAHLRRPFAGR